MSSNARLLAFVALVALLIGVAACSDGGGDSGETEDFALSDQAGTPEESPDVFIDQVAAAVEAGDVQFFIDRLVSEPYTCSEEEVAISTGPDAPPEPICLEEGFTFESVYIQDYPGDTQTTKRGVLISDWRQYFENALTGADDDYGNGGVQLYATGISIQPPATGRDLHTAILTGIHQQIAGNHRTARGIDFEYRDGRWVIVGETAASFPVAVEMLDASASAALYENWARYERDDD